MIKTVVCDFDIDNIKNFKSFFRLNFPDFRIIKDITDHSAIYQALTETDCDLVLSDIRMFGAGSYQVVRDLRQKKPELLIIVYGTFNDTEYMDSALSAGAIAYMYKPVKPADISMWLEKAKDLKALNDKKKKERQFLENQYDRLMPVFEDRFLTNLIHGHLTSDPEIESGLQYFDIGLKPDYGAMVIEIDHYKQISLMSDEREKHLLIHSMIYKINKHINRKKTGIAFIYQFNSICVLFGGLSFEETMTLATDIKTEFHQELSIQVTIGIGKPCSRLSEIPISYKQAKAALRYKAHMGYHTVIPIQYVEPNNDITYRYPLKTEETLVFTAVVGDFEACVVLLDILHEALKKCSAFPKFLLSKIALDIFVSINRYASENNIPFDAQYRENVSMKDINAIETLQDWYTYMKTVLEKLCGAFNETRKAYMNNLYEEIKKYAQANYFESISLSKVAFKMNCTPEFLNRIFMQNDSKSYYDYVIGLRIEKAKSLLGNDDLTDENIASLIGYDDVQYFRSTFFHQTGITTEDYRNKVV